MEMMLPGAAALCSLLVLLLAAFVPTLRRLDEFVSAKKAA
jgi:hypothetical protein